jgi:sphinganine-1-phosphate aldolase
MDLPELGNRVLKHVPPRWISVAERYLQRVPMVRERLSKETDSMLAEMEGGLKPYRGQVPTYTELPAQGRSHEEVLREMEQMNAREQERWKEGFVSGAVYHGDPGHIDFLNRVYALNSQSNPLHADLWPSATKFEAEVVAMTAHLLGAAEANAGRSEDEHLCGSLSSGGTESIMLATKTYRDQARAERGIRHPEMVAPSSAHPAFDKAAHYFGVRMIRVPVAADYRADVQATRKALSRDTVMVIGSAPSFPHGVIDPIEELSELARESASASTPTRAWAASCCPSRARWATPCRPSTSACRG